MGKLILIPTPIGNLKDITFRAVEMLEEVDLILAEDTRTSAKLCAHYNITTQLVAFHMNNEHKVLDRFVNLLKSGQTLGMISDAGTPAISDPGYLLVREALKEGIEVECLPGATAIIPAVVASGMPCDRFYFEGFLPHKKGRQKRIQALQGLDKTVVFYESPHRIIKLLQQLSENGFAENSVAVCRELSKLHEEIWRSTVQEALEEFSSRPSIKGELVVVLDPTQKDA